MGKKYSINSAGRIVSERDIYSLGGFISKGSIGGKIASEEQLSQDGECWIAGGDISSRPDIRIKDNAFIGAFEPGSNPVHTDGVTEFSGNTKIPGRISIRSFSADTKCDMIVRDSFIGIYMNCVCGPATNTKAFPFEQGRFNQDAPKGTLFTSATMRVDADNFVRNTAVLRIGKDTHIYVPQGFNARIYWAYYNDSPSGFAYAGESETATSALYKLSHPVYNTCMVAYARNPTLTPAELEASGARVIGHISGSLLMDLRPESASGIYVMDGSEFIMPTDNFGLNVTQLRFLAGGLINTTMYTKTDRQDYKPYGTFRNVEHLEYTKYLADSFRSNQYRDAFISAYDCPLLRVDDSTYDTSLTNTGSLVLRNCIVPKASFIHNKVLGDTYENIDFSYTQEHIGKTHAGRLLRSSHVQGHYDLFSGGELTGVISRPENLDNTARLTEDHVSIPLDGDIIEQGGYDFLAGTFYEDAKTTSSNRVRPRIPLTTRGAVLPTIPGGFKISYLLYLDDQFLISEVVYSPTSLSGEYPYFVCGISKADDTAITPKELVALNVSITSSDYSKVPIISGSGYVGAGVTVRGDVQVIGQKYEKRYLDVNEWERGTVQDSPKAWEDIKIPTGAGNRFRLVNVIPVEFGSKIACNSGYSLNCYVYASDGTYLGTSNWTQSWTVYPSKAAFVGIIMKKVLAASDPGVLIEESDIPLASVRYITEFKTSRYITNELDRKDPSDIFLSQDAWQVSAISTGSAYVGREYDSLKQASNIWCILKRPINTGKSWTVALGNAVTYVQANSSWDASKKLLGLGVKDNAALTGLEMKKGLNEIVTLLDVPAARFVVEYVPTPRIIDIYEKGGIEIYGTKIRMYDNSVLSKTLRNSMGVVLKGNAVARYDWTVGCMCSNGHDDAIIKLP